MALGCISVGLALFVFFDSRRREKNHERVFALQITDNIKKMSRYFLAVESETKYGEEDEDGEDESVSHMMESLRAFYTRNEQEMKDALQQTRLYLPLWKSLSRKDREMVNETLDLFSWLLYEYYRPALPASLRENVVLASRHTLNTNKYAVAKAAERMTQRCS